MLEHMYNKNTLQIFYLILMLSIQFVEEYVSHNWSYCYSFLKRFTYGAEQ